MDAVLTTTDGVRRTGYWHSNATSESESVMAAKSKSRPEIIISSLDAYRLYNLMDELPADAIEGKDELLAELARARMVAPTEIPPTVVTMNSKVKVVIGNSRKEMELTLVYPQDTDPANQKVSIFAPVGSALLGLSQGDVIEWPKPGGGVLKVKVKEIIYQPERAGEYQV